MKGEALAEGTCQRGRVNRVISLKAGNGAVLYPRLGSVSAHGAPSEQTPWL